MNLKHNTLVPDSSDEIERLRALILDACKVLEHYDLPEHALHYRRAIGSLPSGGQR